MQFFLDFKGKDKENSKLRKKEKEIEEIFCIFCIDIFLDLYYHNL